MVEAGMAKAVPVGSPRSNQAGVPACHPLGSVPRILTIRSGLQRLATVLTDGIPLCLGLGCTQ
jgi:hypothetical protein